MNLYIVAFMSFFATILVSRFISERATKKLNQEQKVHLIDSFSKGRVLSSVFIFLLIGIYFLFLEYNVLPSFYTFLIYIIVLLAYLFTMSFWYYKKLKSSGYPAAFINSYILSTVIKLVGVIILFTVLIYNK